MGAVVSACCALSANSSLALRSLMGHPDQPSLGGPSLGDLSRAGQRLVGRSLKVLLLGALLPLPAGALPLSAGQAVADAASIAAPPLRSAPSPRDSAPLLATWVDQAQTLERRGDLRGALALWQRILATSRAAFGPEDPRLAASLQKLAGLEAALGLTEQARGRLEALLALQRRHLGSDHPEVAQSLGNLATLLQVMGRYQEAEPLRLQALAILEQRLGPDHPDLAPGWNNLALLYSSQGRYGEAEPIARRALAILERSQGHRHPTTAAPLVNLALLLQAQGRDKEATALAQRAWRLRLEQLGPHHPDTNASLNNLASLALRQGRLGEAEALYHRALDGFSAGLGSRHPLRAMVLSNLALVLQAGGRLQEAEALQLQALAIREQGLGADHPDTIQSLNNRALLLRLQGRERDAERLLRQALQRTLSPIWERHPLTATLRDNLATLLLLQGRYNEARPLLLEVNRTQADWLRRELPLQPRGQRLALLQAQPDALATTLALLELDPQAVDLVLETRLNRQGLLAEIERRQRLLAASSPQSRTLAERLGALDRQLATLTLTAAQRQELREQRHQLERELMQQLPALQIAAVQIDQVAAALRAVAPRGVLLEFQRWKPYRRGQQGEVELAPARYGALLLRADGRRGFVPLGEAAPIDRAVGRALSASVTNAAGARERWQEVSRLLLRPLAATLQGVDTLFVVPDGGLHRVPFAALPWLAVPPAAVPSVTVPPVTVSGVTVSPGTVPTETTPAETAPVMVGPAGTGPPGGTAPAVGQEPRWLPEVFALRLLTTGRDLVRLQKAGRAGGEAVLLADPDFDRHREGERRRLPLTGPNRGPIPPGLRSAPAAAPVLPSPSGATDGSRPTGADSSALTSLRSNPAHPPVVASAAGISAAGASAMAPNPDAAGLSAQNRGGAPGTETVVAQVPASVAQVPASAAALAGASAPIAPGGATTTRRPAPKTSLTPIATPPPAERQQRSAELTAARRWAPLPGTAREAQALAPLLAVPRPITDAAATAALVLQQRGPRILHIATHGFFQPESSAADGAGIAPLPRQSPGSGGRLEDPLLRSGLVMAGANQPEADPADDGYLTAAEMTGMELEGTELVTLSACQSGLGDLQTGEGVYGLQRALTVAGSRTTLLSLWKVDDEATAAFMAAFYTRLLQGAGRAAALAHTQAAFRHHTNPSYRSLYVWAAFQLSGDWRPLVLRAPGR